MLKIGILGTGSFSAVHLAAYLKQKQRCRVAVLFNRTPEKAEAFAAEHSLEDVRICKNIDEFIAAKPDLVSICTPPSLHADHAVLCLENNISVLLEKPMAASLEECDRILEAGKNSKAIFSVVAQNRFVSANWKLKQVLDSGLAGKLNFIGIDSSWWRAGSYYDLYWRGTWQHEGGGCTLNHAVHHIDLLLWFAGRPDRVKAFLANIAHDKSEVEDLSMAMLSWNSGAAGRIMGSLVHHGEQKNIVLQCEKAMITEPWQSAASRDRGDGFPVPDVRTAEKIAGYYRDLDDPALEGMDGQVNDVLNALENGGSVLIDGKAGRMTIELVTAMYSSHFQDRTETLPLGRDHLFYSRDGMLAHTAPLRPQS